GGGNVGASQAGYPDSQCFANILPVMLLVFAIGVAAWSVAGDERAGTLELLLANPIRRVTVALARLCALVVMLAVLVGVGALTLVGLAPTTGLDKGLSAGHVAAATA